MSRLLEYRREPDFSVPPGDELRVIQMMRWDKAIPDDRRPGLHSPLSPKEHPAARRLGVLSRIAAWVLVILLLPAIPVGVYRYVDPPLTPIMLIRGAEGAPPMRYDWRPMSQISPALAKAVIASEDQKFCAHDGFDWAQLGRSISDYQAGRRLRGASTISMQTAKNLFLWPDRSFIRKGFEAWITVWIEVLWPKSRILETYLNIVEWGPGVYGAEAAAQAHFRKAAVALSSSEAALLAAVLPNPRTLSASQPSAFVRERAAVIGAQAFQVTATCR